MSKLKDIPGYIIIGGIVLLALATWGIYGVTQLIDHRSTFEKLTS